MSFNTIKDRFYIYSVPKTKNKKPFLRYTHFKKVVSFCTIDVAHIIYSTQIISPHNYRKTKHILLHHL